MHEVRRPITIMAFTTPNPESCCSIEPELTSLVDRFNDKAVTVVQISQPTPECPEGPGCVEVCSGQKADLLALCDAERTAWIRYGEPEPGSVVLIDNMGKIVDISTMENLESIAHNAEILANRKIVGYLW